MTSVSVPVPTPVYTGVPLSVSISTGLPRTALRGFAAMTLRGENERVRALGSKGGKTAQATARAHRWSREEASAAAKRSWERRRQLAAGATALALSA